MSFPFLSGNIFKAKDLLARTVAIVIIIIIAIVVSVISFWWCSCLLQLQLLPKLLLFSLWLFLWQQNTKQTKTEAWMNEWMKNAIEWQTRIRALEDPSRAQTGRDGTRGSNFCHHIVISQQLWEITSIAPTKTSHAAIHPPTYSL